MKILHLIHRIEVFININLCLKTSTGETLQANLMAIKRFASAKSKIIIKRDIGL